MAAFSISAYGSSNARASHKPFNPLLGETFECIREDKGFRYVAEQVSPSSSQDLMIVTNCPRWATILPSLGSKRTAPDGPGVRLGLLLHISCISCFLLEPLNLVGASSSLCFLYFLFFVETFKLGWGFFFFVSCVFCWYFLGILKMLETLNLVEMESGRSHFFLSLKNRKLRLITLSMAALRAGNINFWRSGQL